MQLSRVLVGAYGERAAALARGRLPLHDTAFDALQQACAQADGGAGALLLLETRPRVQSFSGTIVAALFAGH